MVTKLKIAIIAVVAIAAIVGITLGIVYGTRSNDDDDTSCSSVDADEFVDVGVSDLAIATAGNEATVTWVRPTGYDKCDMQYQVTVGDGPPVIVNDPVHTTSLEYCAQTTISVVPFIVGDFGKPEAKDATADVSAGFAKVDSLNLEIIGDKLKASWEQPEGFNACQFTYKWTFNGAAEADPIPETEKEFELTDGLCADYTIEVIPVVNQIEGESDDTNIKTGVDAAEFVDVGVSDLAIATAANEATVTWVRPTGYDKCDMQYQVTVGDAAPVIVNDPVHTTSLEYCAQTTISVVPVVIGDFGKPEAKDATADVSAGFAKVDSLNLEKTGDNLKASWEQPEGFAACQFTYKLTFNGAAEADPISETEQEFELTDGLCADYTIEVIPVVNQIEGESDDKSIKAGVDAAEFVDVGVSDLAIATAANEATVTWVRPSGYDKCDMRYQVTVGDGPPVIVNDPVHTTSLEYCAQTTISVMPVIVDVFGKPEPKDATADVSAGFAKVDSLNLEKIGDKLKASWEQPEGFAACQFTYKLTFNGAAEADPIPETEKEFELTDGLCADYTIEVIPVVNQIEGESDDKNIETGVDADEFVDVGVSDLAIATAGNEATVTWVRPSGYDKCDMQYQVTVGDGQPVIVNDPVHTTSLEYCAQTTISVVPVIVDVFGKPEPKDATADVSAGFAKVISLNLSKNGDKLMVSWQQPFGFAACQFTYKLTFNGAAETDPISETVKEYDLTDGSCADYTIEITPVVNDIEGEPDDIYIKTGVDAAELADVGVSDLAITTAGNEATVTWVRPTGYDKCDMLYQVEVGEGEPVYYVYDPVHTTYLKYCALTTISVVPWIIGDLGKPEAKDATVDVSEGFAKVDSLNLEQIGDKLNASWEQPEGFAECQFTYKLIFNGAAETDPISETEKEFELTDGLCADYTIEVIPVVNGIEGESDVKEQYIGVSEGFDKVTDLDVSITGKDALITWVGPEGFENCLMEYRVNVGDRQPEDVTGSPYTTSLEYCDPTTITVVPVIDGIFGLQDGGSAEITPDDNAIGKVVIIPDIEEGKFKATWDKPSGLGRCILTYVVELKQDANTLQTLETLPDVTTYEFDLTDVCPGNDFEFTVVAKYDDTPGDISTTSVSCPVQ